MSLLFVAAALVLRIAWSFAWRETNARTSQTWARGAPAARWRREPAFS